MARILIGVAAYKPHAKFEESLSNLETVLLQNGHDIFTCWVQGYQLVDAQNKIAEKFLSSKYDNLLMLEDDNWGHTYEMVESLINADTDVCAIKYYSRHPVFICCLMEKFYKKDGRFRFREAPLDTTGYMECDLVPFGMTLIKKHVFDKLDKPYFQLNEVDERELEISRKYNIQESYATDRNFSFRCRQNGLKLKGCFDHCLVHDGVDESNVYQLRNLANKEFYTWHMLFKNNMTELGWDSYWNKIKPRIFKTIENGG